MEIDYPFAIVDGFYGEAPPVGLVDYIDNRTNPNFDTYTGAIANKTIVPLQASRIEHLGGYIYIKKTPWGHLK